MTSQNINLLTSPQSTNAINSSSKEQVDGKIICYLNLQVDKKSGAFLELSKKISGSEEILNASILVKTQHPLSDKVFTKLELIDQDLPTALKLLIEKSLKAFNELSSK